jgi:YidC/Oxa1 family membrane protein insertase
MEKRTLLAIAISLIVLGFYPVILQKFYPEYGKAPKSAATMPLAEKTSAPPASVEMAHELPLSELSPQKDVIFENARLKLLFNSKGGVAREIRFPDFIDSETKEPLKLLSLSKNMAAPFQVSFLSAPLESDPGLSEYKIQKLSENEIVTLAFGKQLEVSKHYQFDEGKYSGKVILKFKNISSSPLDFRYQFFAGSSIIPRHSIDGQYIEANFFSIVDGKKNLKHIRQTKLGKTVESQGFVDWIAVKDRHFSVILKPAASNTFTGLTQGLGDNKLGASLVSSPVILSPGASTQQEFLLYIGPNDLKELDPLGLGGLVNFGKLDSIGKVLVGGLELSHKVFRNYGLAIIALTTLLNLLLFPLTRTGYMSMKRMQLVQPQMTKLRQQHKNNPERLNREMMELYKKHKVNPFGGCLPMALQMPVFIALYVALSKAVILINAKFLWIQDLSSPDNIPLPFSLPLIGDKIHLLPLLMVAGMVVQQKFTQVKMEGADPAAEAQQRMMMVLMPLIFGFVFYTMPSGLVLYWLTNTVLMTAYQWRLKSVTLS